MSVIVGVERSFLSFLDEPFFYLHIILGIAIVIVVGYNSNELLQTEVPLRIKKVARAAFGMSIASVVTVAMVTQASSVATAYDMWEEKEFEQKSSPGIDRNQETLDKFQEKPEVGEPPEQ